MYHFCPTCGSGYRCPCETASCGSPWIYDCHACYRRRHRAELDRLLEALTERLGVSQGFNGHGDTCNAY